MAHQPSGWYTDPTGRYEYRYWNGTQWTTEVSSAGTSTTDATAMDPNMAGTPPAPGTGAPSAPPTPTQPTVQVTQKSGSAIGTIIGIALGVIAVIVLILVLVNQSDDSTDVSTPPTTSAQPTPTSPATTVAP